MNLMEPMTAGSQRTQMALPTRVYSESTPNRDRVHKKG
ncbi:hypothetical protein D3OALGA1CA_2171 [Olavius algarvensis associated proteobacterium Delta 3]|nr:hypothetical protein D3OALGA1CA_2171 [Olavius algarvensis associated proteobacterium Delta 3]CAB5161689.1 hypothetical protein D3OALGB2SA_5469 [Olavius algarvensis associated proteobacterium Delta 3]